MRTSRILPWKPSPSLIPSRTRVGCAVGRRHMPARTGQQYINGLREQEREIWLGGERVRDVTTHKGLSGGVRAVAALYDMQHEAELRSVMTYPSPSSGAPVGRSFDNPTTREALETRTRMM